jgi:hypothetical protein
MLPAFLIQRLRWPILAVVYFAMAPATPACTIPVFRYALERWELAPYEVIVFHRDALPADDRAALEALPRQGNFTSRSAAVDDPLDPILAGLWEWQRKAATLPWVVVRRPEATPTTPVMWSGPLDRARLKPFADSPARQRIVGELRGGASGIFVLLESGDRAADAAAGELLRTQLAKLEKLVKLPEQRGDGPRIRLALPLKVSLPVLEVKRDDPDEALFVQVLLGSEPQLAGIRGPILFPVFGRGRLLGSLYGKDLNRDSLFEVVSFLCGECSCEVKELNPGMDLPISADWPAIFAKIGPAPESGPEAPPGATRIAARAKPSPGPLLVATGVSKGGGEEDQVRVAVSQYPPDAEFDRVPTVAPALVTADAREVPLHRRWLWLATLVAGLLVILTGSWVYIHARRGVRPHQS